MRNGWQYISLADLTKRRPICYGVLKPGERQSSGVPLIRITDITTDELDESDIYHITPGLSAQFKRSVLDGNEVLLSIQGTIGRVAICPSHLRGANISRTIALISPDDRLARPFLRYWLLSLRGGFPTAGSTRASLNIGALRELLAPVPSVPEQQEIVGILDEAFEAVATAKSNAEQNLSNARALFESHLQAVFTQHGAGWTERRLEDVCERITDGAHHSPKTQFPTGGPGRFLYITSKNIRNNFLDLSKVSFVEQDFHDEIFRSCRPSLGDVLLTKDGANTGNVTLNTIDEPFSLLSSVCLIKTHRAVLLPGFLCFYLQSSTGLQSLIGQMTGAAIKRIVLRDIKRAAVPFPPILEQERIVTTLESLLAETKRLAILYERKLASFEALKTSLLHQAFNGQLQA